MVLWTETAYKRCIFAFVLFVMVCFIVMFVCVAGIENRNICYFSTFPLMYTPEYSILAEYIFTMSVVMSLLYG